MASATAGWAVSLLHALLLLVVLHRPAAAELLTSRSKRDLVTSIPGYSQPLKHFSGFVTVGGAKPTGRLYYYLATAPSPATSPLIVWMQNAPDCSSMLGMVYEHGPFRVKMNDPAGKSVDVTDNPFSWNKMANVIYVDLPGGNGFSTAKVPAWAPDGTAGQLVQFMKAFYVRFPALLSVPLFVAGQTAGVPTMLLATQRLHREIKNSPLRGYIAISGRANECRFDEGARVAQILKNRLISAKSIAQYKGICPKGPCPGNQECPFTIATTVLAVDTELNRYGASCPRKPFGRRLLSRPDPLPTAASVAASQRDPTDAAAEQLHGSSRRLRAASNRTPGGTMTCGDYRAAGAFFDNAGVRKALHIPALNPAVQDSFFSGCRGSTKKRSARIRSPPIPVLPLHRNLIRTRGLRGLLVYGIDDLEHPWLGGRQIAAGVGLPRTRTPVPVKVGGRKVAAIEAYGAGPGRNLTFAVVDNAGAYIGQDQPEALLHLVKRFIVRRNIET